MFKIKNRVLLGFLAGTISAFVGGSLNAVEYRLGLIDINYTQIASALFLPKRISESSQGIISGTVIRYFIVCLISTFITYVISLSGRKNAAVKSIGITLSTGFMAVEIIPKFILNIKIQNPLYHYLSLFDHILSAVIISKIILKFGDLSKIPEKHQ